MAKDPKKQSKPTPNRKGNEGRPVVERKPDDKQSDLNQDIKADNVKPGQGE